MHEEKGRNICGKCYDQIHRPRVIILQRLKKICILYLDIQNKTSPQIDILGWVGVLQKILTIALSPKMNFPFLDSQAFRAGLETCDLDAGLTIQGWTLTWYLDLGLKIYGWALTWDLDSGLTIQGWALTWDLGLGLGLDNLGLGFDLGLGIGLDNIGLGFDLGLGLGLDNLGL